MSNIKITARVTDSKLEIVNPVLLSSGSRDVVQVQLEFNALWDGYAKIAYFYRESGKEKGKVYHALLSNNVATVPHEVLAEEGTFFFGIWGEGGNFPTTEAVRLNVTKGLITLEKVESDPTPDIYQQVIASYHSMENRFNEEMARLDSLIAMRSNEVEREYTFSDAYVEGMIRTNGASAYIETRIKGDMELDQDDAYWIVLPANLAPLMPTALKNEHNPTELAISLELEDNGELRLYFRNLTQGYIIFGYTFASATYPLAHVALDELVDARTGASGKVYPSTGEAIRKQFGQLDGRTSALAKRVTNLEQGKIPSPFVTDSSMAYQKIAPENALPFAELSKLGGMTRRCTNLADIVASSNVTISNGVVTQIKADTNNTPYSKIQQIGSNGQLIADNIISTIAIGKSEVTIELLDGTTRIAFGLNGSTIDSLIRFQVEDLPRGTYTFSCEFTNATQGSVSWKNTMFNPGPTALPYEPFFEGFRSAPVSEVESEGANLLPYPYYYDSRTINGITFTVNGDGTITANGTATNTAFFLFTVDLYLPAGTYYVDDSVDMGEDAYVRANLFRGVFTTDGSRVEVELRVAGGATLNNVTFKPMINKGPIARPYSPYSRSLLPIPEAVQALDGYGEGLDASCFNYVDWKNKQFTLKAYRFKLVSGVGSYSGDPAEKVVFYGLPYATFFGCKVLCSHFESDGTNGAGTALRIDGFSSIEEFDAFVTENEVYVVYELATPEVTDISDLLTSDNFVNAGTITFKNPHGLEVPSEITYQIKEASV